MSQSGLGPAPPAPMSLGRLHHPFHRSGSVSATRKAIHESSSLSILHWRIALARSVFEISPKGSIRLSLRSIRPSIGTENPIPEEMNHREIAVRVPVMNEMQFLFPSEPCKSLKPRSLYVVFLIEKDVRVKRRRTRD